MDQERYTSKKCYKISERSLDCMNIVYNDSNSMFMLWNKYQIFVYENFDFDNLAKIFVPEFLISSLIVSNNCLVCLDCTGNVHITSLKLKNSAQKRFRSSFQPREKGILSCTASNSDNLLCLKVEGDMYWLTQHKINLDLQLEKKAALEFNDKHKPLLCNIQEKCIIYSHLLNRSDFECLKDKFNIKDTVVRKYSLVLISFDKTTLYACLFSPEMPDEALSVVKLYTTVSEMCDVKIIETNELNIIIGLTIGTIIQIPLRKSAEPNIVHLNICLSKFLSTKSSETMIYSDGETFWKSENTLSKMDITFQQFFVKLVKDFVRVGDQLICTTYSGLLYSFPVDDDASFFTPPTTDKYCPAETLMDNSECLYKIMAEVEKCKELSKKLKIEGSYLTALALSRRQDIMDQVIKMEVIVFDSYEDAIKDNPDISLTEEQKPYFEDETFFFLIKLNCDITHSAFKEVLSNVFGDLKIHINLLSKHKLLKTTSIKVNEPLTKMQVLVPLKAACFVKQANLKIDLKIVTNMPGSFDETKEIWTVLYRKCIALTSEYFVRTTKSSNVKMLYKKPENSMENLILQSACNQYGILFNFTDITENKNASEWNLYIKLPENVNETLVKEIHKRGLNPQKANYFEKEFSSTEFLNSKSDLCFEVGDDKVSVEIVRLFSIPHLRISSMNLIKALHLRNFISNLIFINFEENYQKLQYIDYSLYATIDNQRKCLEECILNGDQTVIRSIAEEFHRVVYGALPL